MPCADAAHQTTNRFVTVPIGTLNLQTKAIESVELSLLNQSALTRGCLQGPAVKLPDAYN